MKMKYYFPFPKGPLPEGEEAADKVATFFSFA